MERYYDLLVKEKENHDRLEARAQGGEGGGGGWIVHDSHLRHSLRPRAQGSLMTSFGEHFGLPSGSGSDEAPPRGGSVGGHGGSGLRGFWLHRTGPPGMRVLRLAPVPGNTASFRSTSLFGQHTASDDDSDFPPYEQRGWRHRQGLIPRGARAGVDLLIRTDSDDEDSSEAAREDTAAGGGVSSSVSNYHVMSPPPRRGYGGRSAGGLRQALSLPSHTRAVVTEGDATTTVTSVLPGRTSYILRVVHAEEGEEVGPPRRRGHSWAGDEGGDSDR